MTLKRFLDCAYSLLVDGYRQIGMDLLSAVEKVNASLGLAQSEAAVVAVPSQVDNDAALRELQKMMGGLSR